MQGADQYASLRSKINLRLDALQKVDVLNEQYDSDIKSLENDIKELRDFKDENGMHYGKYHLNAVSIDERDAYIFKLRQQLQLLKRRRDMQSKRNELMGTEKNVDKTKDTNSTSIDTSYNENESLEKILHHAKSINKYAGQMNSHLESEIPLLDSIDSQLGSTQHRLRRVTKQVQVLIQKRTNERPLCTALTLFAVIWLLFMAVLYF